MRPTGIRPALSRVALAAVALAAVTAMLAAGCTVTPARQPAPATATGGGGCPVPSTGAVDAGSVLVPGPTDGLPRSDAAGEALILATTVLTPACAPAEGASVVVWHTDARGDYRPANDTRCCFYRGTVLTDQNGRFRLDTIRPAQYRQPAAPPAHIHLEILHESGHLVAEFTFSATPQQGGGAGGTRGGLAYPLTNVPIYLASTGTPPGQRWYGEAVLVLQP